MVQGPDNHELLCPLRYERLPDFCYDRGLTGHSQRECPLVSSERRPDKLEYGAWLRADFVPSTVIQENLEKNTPHTEVNDAADDTDLSTLTSVGEDTAAVTTAQPPTRSQGNESPKTGEQEPTSTPNLTTAIPKSSNIVVENLQKKKGKRILGFGSEINTDVGQEATGPEMTASTVMSMVVGSKRKEGWKRKARNVASDNEPMDYYHPVLTRKRRHQDPESSSLDGAQKKLKGTSDERGAPLTDNADPLLSVEAGY